MLGIYIIIHGSRKTLLCRETLGEFIKIYASIREEELHSSLLYKNLLNIKHVGSKSPTPRGICVYSCMYVCIGLMDNIEVGIIVHFKMMEKIRTWTFGQKENKQTSEKAGRRSTHLIWVFCMVGSGGVGGGLWEQQGLVSTFPAENPASRSAINPAVCFKPMSVWPWPAIIIDRAVGSAFSDSKQIIHMDFIMSVHYKTVLVLVQNSKLNYRVFVTIDW